MNPIIVIGMVSLITAGLYGIYAGIEQQAELGEVQRSMLALTHASSPGMVEAEYTKRGHIIITNNWQQGNADVIQFRKYAQDNTLDSVWTVNHTVLPLHTKNLTVLPLDLSDALKAAKNSTADGSRYKGVTSQGVVFPVKPAIVQQQPVVITPTPPSLPPQTPPTTPPGDGNTVLLGGGSSSQSDTDQSASYHYAESNYWCNHKSSKMTKWSLYDQPFQTGPGGLTETPVPKGAASWYVWQKQEPIDRQQKPFCGGDYNRPVSFNPNNPQGLVRLQANVWKTPPSYPITAAFDKSGVYTVKQGGASKMFVEVPVSGSVSATYDFVNYFTERKTYNFDDCDYTLGTPVVQNALQARKDGVGMPTFKLVVDGLPVPSFLGPTTIEAAHPTVTSVVNNPQFSTMEYTHHCVHTLTGTVSASWTYGTTISGITHVFNARNGQNLDVDLAFRLEYTPDSAAGDVKSTSTDMTASHIKLTLVPHDF